MSDATTQPCTPVLWGMTAVNGTSLAFVVALRPFLSPAKNALAMAASTAAFLGTGVAVAAVLSPEQPALAFAASVIQTVATGTASIGGMLSLTVALLRAAPAVRTPLSTRRHLLRRGIVARSQRRCRVTRLATLWRQAWPSCESTTTLPATTRHSNCCCRPRRRPSWSQSPLLLQPFGRTHSSRRTQCCSCKLVTERRAATAASDCPGMRRRWAWRPALRNSNNGTTSCSRIWKVGI